MPEVQKRILTGRITKPQRSRLLELMKEHRSVGLGQLSSKDAKREHAAVWSSVALELNAMGGSFKKADQWKKSWIDWKSSVKKQHSEHRAFIKRTGNLNDLSSKQRNTSTTFM